MEREDIAEMKNEELMSLFERLLRGGVGSDFYILVWARAELKERLEKAGSVTTVDHQVERCTTCGEPLADGMGHDHRDTAG